MIGKKKILFLEYFPFIAGGQNVLLSIIENLKNDYDVEALIFNRGEIENRLNKLKIKYHFIQAPKTVKYRYFLTFAKFNKEMYGFIKDGKYDLIYTSGHFSTKLVVPALKKFKIPLIWHKHLIIDKGYFSYMASQMRKLSKFADKIICVSDASKKSMEKAGVDPGKLVTVYNGVEKPAINLKSIRNKTRKKYAITKEDFLCGTVCIFRKDKGLELLIKTAGIINGKGIPMKFMLVGRAEKTDEAYEEQLKMLAEEKVPGNSFIFTGYANKWDFIPAFDLSVMPSPKEPFGLVTIEAFSAGVPVAGFAGGGTEEIIKDGYNGYLAAEVTAENLAQIILAAYDDRKKLKQMSKNAVDSVKKNFTVEKQMRKIKEIINSVIK